jgi:hypothetical protein
MYEKALLNLRIDSDEGHLEIYFDSRSQNKKAAVIASGLGGSDKLLDRQPKIFNIGKVLNPMHASLKKALSDYALNLLRQVSIKHVVFDPPYVLLPAES